MQQKKRQKKHVSEGCELLSEFMRLRCLKKSVVAKKFRVSHATVGRWLTGERRPTQEHRALMQLECGIPESSWCLTEGEASGIAWVESQPAASAASA